MRSTAAATLLALVIVSSPSLTAQEPATAKYFYAGGGIELAHLSGLSLQAGYARQRSRLGLRLGVAYYQVASRTAGGVTFDLTHDLSRTRVQPYVIGGLGLYRVVVRNRYFSGGERLYSLSMDHGLMLYPGAGLRIPLGHKVEAFTEARFKGLYTGHLHASLPLTFGIRF